MTTAHLEKPTIHLDQPGILGGRLPCGDDVVMVVRSVGLLAAVEKVRRLARSNLPLLILGETGTGKELLARLVHAFSGRRGPLVAVDCGAIPDDLVESILFGHRRGAFTGAVDHAEGVIERADGGTLFLDEMGSLPLRSQTKFLRVIETGEVTRLGAACPNRVDFRLVSTFLEDGTAPVREGRFRLDLMHRLGGAVIRIPPLVERPADIVPLARHFAGRAGCRLDVAVERELLQRPWPGNVRELRWTVERASLLATDGVVGLSALHEAQALAPSRYLGGDSQADVGRTVTLEGLCRVHRGDADRIAVELGIGKSTLYRRLREAGLVLRRFKRADVS